MQDLHSLVHSLVCGMSAFIVIGSWFFYMCPGGFLKSAVLDVVFTWDTSCESATA